MLLKRFYDEKLAQASYLVGCAATGEALVIDPNRDVRQYIEAAWSEGLRIVHVTETHIHADFVSGGRELAERTGATLHLSDEGGPDWRYAFAADAGVTLVRDGDHFMVGNVRVDVLHTPGHTPEHVSFMITDTPATDRPMGIFTGDFIFAGDVGRPDLLERAAHMKGTMEESARTLFRSLQAFREREDYLQLWPGHGAGSACGKSLGAVPSTTLGYEKLANWGFSVSDEDEFVRRVLAGQPEAPVYFAEMKRINRDGPRLLHGLPRPERLRKSAFVAQVERGAIMVDTRQAASYAARHVPGTINIPLDRSFTTWAGWLLPYDEDIYLIVDERHPDDIDEAIRDLAMIGLDRIAGYSGVDALSAWTDGSGSLASVARTKPAELASDMASGSVTVLDVRSATEWEAGHLPGAVHIPLGYLPGRLDELPRGGKIVVQCQSGARSAIAASVLRARGFDAVVNLEGGFAAWTEAGYPVERGANGASAELDAAAAAGTAARV